MAEVFHGGGLDAAMADFGGTRDEWLDLSTGINPKPYPVPEISADAWARLPDKAAEARLLEAARAYYGVPEEFEIVAAPGTQALIQILPRVLETQEVAIISPTYGEHAHAWKKADVRVTEVAELDEVDGFIRHAVVVNPNNPDGRERPIEELQRISERVDCLIVDEAFCDAVPENSLVNDMPRNAIVLKSFGKFFGLAGVRLGFVICKKEWAEKFCSSLGPWAVSGAALEIGTAALSDAKWIAETRFRLAETSGKMVDLLSKTGLKIEGKSPLFLYVSLGDAGSVYRHLAKKKILVRPFPERLGYLRFGLCKDDGDLDRLSQALDSF